MLTKQLGLFEISMKRSYVQYHPNQYFAEVHFQCTVAINLKTILLKILNKRFIFSESQTTYTLQI